MQDINYSKEKLMHEKNSSNMNNSRKVFNIILLPILIIVLVIFSIFLLNEELVLNFFYSYFK